MAIELAENTGIDLHRRDRQGGGQRADARGGRLAPGRAARSAADRRGHDGADPLRLREDGPHPVHRGRRVSPQQAERPDAGVAGAISHPRRAASDLTKEDFVRILTEPKGALTKQYQALLETEGVELVFEEDAIEALADYAYNVNRTTQNIGARRLYTILERLLEELSFEAPDMKMGRVVVNAAYVRERLDKISQDEDLSKFIL